MGLEGKHIFIVEDDVHNRLVYKLLLFGHGATVDFEGWGPDAIRHLKKLAKVDLIILDLMLQRGKSGYEIFAEIRKLHEYDDVPIVAVSAAEPGVAIASTREQGFSGFVAKPIDQCRFPKQIEQIMEGKEVWYAGMRFEGVGS